MNKILKFNNAILNLDNLEVIEANIEMEFYGLHFTNCIVLVNLTEEEFQYLTEFLKSDFKFHEINKPVNRINNNINEINNNINKINNSINRMNMRH